MTDSKSGRCFASRVHQIAVGAWLGSCLGSAVLLFGAGADYQIAVAAARLAAFVVVPSIVLSLVSGIGRCRMESHCLSRIKIIIKIALNAVALVLALVLVLKILGPFRAGEAMPVPAVGAVAFKGALVFMALFVFAFLGYALTPVQKGVEPEPEAPEDIDGTKPGAKGGKNGISKKLLFFPVAALGILAVVVAVKGKQPPKRLDAREKARVVRVVPATMMRVAPAATGYGVLKPVKEWQAVAEVGGKVVFIDPRLDEGALLTMGTEALRIDPTEYKLVRDKAAAAIKSLNARLDELRRRENNLKKTLSVEKKSLNLSEKEFSRKKGLLKDGNIAASEVDLEEKSYFVQQNKVQSVQNELNLIPATRDSLNAELSQARTTLEQAELDIAKTVLTVPFDCRVSAVNVEKAQYVKPGEVMMVAEGSNRSEVAARIPLSDFSRLVAAGAKAKGKLDSKEVQRVLGLKALVRVRFKDDTYVWRGRVTRMAESIDSRTRTIGVYVEVEDTAHGDIQVESFLMKNLFCEVELVGNPGPPVVVVPRSALFGGKAGVVGKDDRLEIRAIRTGVAQFDYVSVVSGISPGELVVVSDIAPAVSGMLLKPEQDEKLLRELKREVAGNGTS